MANVRRENKQGIWYMRKPEDVDMKVDWGKLSSHVRGNRSPSDKRIYYKRLRQKIKKLCYNEDKE